jgi:hypothetical protein
VARHAVIGGQIGGAMTITRAFRSVRYWRQSGLNDREVSVLLRCRRGFFGIRCQAFNNVGRAISRQNLRDIGLVTAFELLGLLGTMP